MKAERLRLAVANIAGMPGLDGCALVEIAAGMAWHAVGDLAELQEMAEASSDYWRLYQRSHRHFDRLGDLRAQVMMHRTGRITMLPCTNGMLLIAISRESEKVDWALLHQKSHQLNTLIADL